MLERLTHSGTLGAAEGRPSGVGLVRDGRPPTTSLGRQTQPLATRATFTTVRMPMVTVSAAITHVSRSMVRV